MQKVKGVIALSRYKEVLGNVALLTVFGLFLTITPGAVQTADLRSSRVVTIIILLAANILATTFAFMINDVEDAEDDAKDEKKAKRNPISAGHISRNFGYVVSFSVAFLALLLYLLLDTKTFLVGLSLIVLGFLYSWKKVRLKGMPFLDILSHGYFLAGGILLASFFPFSSDLSLVLPPFLVAYTISIAGDLFNEIRDFTVDRKAGLKNTVSIIGLRPSVIFKTLMYITAAVLGIFVAYTHFSSFNPVALLGGLVVTVAIFIYVHLFSSRPIADLDNALLFNSLITVAFLVITISIFY